MSGWRTPRCRIRGGGRHDVGMAAARERDDTYEAVGPREYLDRLLAEYHLREEDLGDRIRVRTPPQWMSGMVAPQEYLVHESVLITEAAVQEDALTAALNLTALAATAVTALAATTGRNPDEVLRSLYREGFGEFSRQPNRSRLRFEASTPPQVVYPDPRDDDDWAMTEVKGWLEVTVRWADGEQTITFYHPIRLAQTVQSALVQPGYFAERSIVVVPRLTKEAVESTVAAMTRYDFVDVR